MSGAPTDEAHALAGRERDGIVLRRANGGRCEAGARTKWLAEEGGAGNSTHGTNRLQSRIESVSEGGGRDAGLRRGVGQERGKNQEEFRSHFFLVRWGQGAIARGDTDGLDGGNGRPGGRRGPILMRYRDGGAGAAGSQDGEDRDDSAGVAAAGTRLIPRGRVADQVDVGAGGKPLIGYVHVDGYFSRNLIKPKTLGDSGALGIGDHHQGLVAIRKGAGGAFGRESEHNGRAGNGRLFLVDYTDNGSMAGLLADHAGGAFPLDYDNIERRRKCLSGRRGDAGQLHRQRECERLGQRFKTEYTGMIHFVTCPAVKQFVLRVYASSRKSWRKPDGIPIIENESHCFSGARLSNGFSLVIAIRVK